MHPSPEVGDSVKVRVGKRKLIDGVMVKVNQMRPLVRVSDSSDRVSRKHSKRRVIARRWGDIEGR